jgi:hypothetical protein
MPLIHDLTFMEANTGPVQARMHDWEAFLQSRILGLQVLADAKTSFFSSARMGDFGALSITRYEVAPQIMSRSSRHANDGDEAHCLTILEKGSFVARRNGVSARLLPGSATLMPANASSVVHVIEPSVFWGIKLVDLDAPIKPALQSDRCDLRILGGKDVDILMSYCQLIDQLPQGARSETIAKTITAHIYDLIATSLERATG